MVPVKYDLYKLERHRFICYFGYIHTDSISFLDTNRRVDAPEITESDSAPCSQTTDAGTTNTCTPQIKIFWLYEGKIISIPRYK